MGILPIVFLAAVWVMLALRGRMIQATLFSWLIFGSVIFIFTEVGSLFHALTPNAARIAWGVLTALASGMAVRRILKNRESLPDFRLPFRREPLGAVICLCVCLVTFVVAIVSPPNTWDSLTYHMPRVMVWQQQHTLCPPFLSDSRMVFMPPWTEYAILQFQLLAGSDRFANVTQWLAGLVSMIGMFGVARWMKLRPVWACSVAAMLVATNPMTILQMSSTQTDLATSAFVVCAIGLIVLSIRRYSWQVAAWQGIAIGLAVLTKQTAVFFLAPFCVWSGVVLIRRINSTRAVGRAAMYPLIVGCIAGAIYLPHYLRVAHAPNRGVGQVDRNSNDRLGVDVLASNFVRSSAMHVQALLDRPFWHDGVKHAVIQIHRVIGLAVDDRATTTFPQYVTRGYSTNEDLAGSPVHFVVELLAVIGILLFPRKYGWKMWGYALCIALGTLIMLAVLKWSPYRQRYHLPLMILGAIPVCAALQTWLRSRAIQTGLVVLAVLYAVPCLTTNSTRPLARLANLASARSIFIASRTELLFATDKKQQAPFEELTRQLERHHVRRLAVFRGDHFEYAIWNMAGERIPGFEIVHAPWTRLNAPIPDVDARAYFGDFARAAIERGWPVIKISEEIVLVVDRPGE